MIFCPISASFCVPPWIVYCILQRVLSLGQYWGSSDTFPIGLESQTPFCLFSLMLSVLHSLQGNSLSARGIMNVCFFSPFISSNWPCLLRVNEGRLWKVETGRCSALRVGKNLHKVSSSLSVLITGPLSEKNVLRLSNCNFLIQGLKLTQIPQSSEISVSLVAQPPIAC